MKPLSLRSRSRRFQATVAVAALGAAGAVTALGVLLFGGGSHTPHVVANNISRNFRACLITTDPDQPSAQASWSGLRDAARTGTINAQRIVVPAAAKTSKERLPYVESLVQRQCGLIVSAGPHLDEAIAAAAAKDPHQRFLTTGTPLGLPNTTTLTHPTSAAVANAVRTASRNRSTTRSPTPHS